MSISEQNDNEQVEQLLNDIQYLRGLLKTRNVQIADLQQQIANADNGLTFDAYQRQAQTTASYPPERGIEYCLIGLVGEAGELANKYKKVIRGDYTLEDIKSALADESADILWYTAMLLHELGFDFGLVAQSNLDKLADRKSRNVIQGDGDTR